MTLVPTDINPTQQEPPVNDTTREARRAQRAQRAQQQLLEYHRDLQAALYALSKDFAVTGLDLNYNLCLTKTFYAHAHDGTPLRTTLSLAVVDPNRQEV
jgi:hypothetical protein